MRTKEYIMQMPSRLSGTTEPDTIKRCLYVLIVIAVILALGPIFLSQKSQQSPWLFTSGSFTLRPHSLDNLIKQRYVLLDEDDLAVDKDDFTIEGSKGYFESFSIANLKLLTSPLINSYWAIFFDTIKSSPYISFFASLPLRSPPLFS